MSQLETNNERRLGGRTPTKMQQNMELSHLRTRESLWKMICQDKKKYRHVKTLESTIFEDNYSNKEHGDEFDYIFEINGVITMVETQVIHSRDKMGLGQSPEIWINEDKINKLLEHKETWVFLHFTLDGYYEIPADIMSNIRRDIRPKYNSIRERIVHHVPTSRLQNYFIAWKTDNNKETKNVA